MNLITWRVEYLTGVSDVGRLRVGALPRLSSILRVVHALPRVDVGARLAGIACNGRAMIKTYPVI